MTLIATCVALNRHRACSWAIHNLANDRQGALAMGLTGDVTDTAGRS